MGYGFDMKTKTTANIHDVAKLSGFSIATVSLAIKDDPRVNNNTREFVKKCATELNYRPNYLAKSLVTRNTNNIGVIASNLNNPVFSEIISGVEEIISGQGYYLTIGVTNFDVDCEKHYLDMFSHNRADGIILLPNDWERIRDDVFTLCDSGYPVCVSGINPKTNKISYVTGDMAEGAFLSIEHLIKLGHRKIGFLAGSRTSASIEERYAGYKKAMRIYGIDVSPEYVINTETDLASIRNSLKLFLSKNSDVTAIYCMYDYIAMAAIKAIGDLNLRVPEDISVVGYDNIAISEYYSVGLTTVDPGNKQIGQLSGRILVNMITKTDYEHQHMMLSPKLIVRESASAAR